MLFALFPLQAGSDARESRVARGRLGMAATSTPYATDAAVAMLEKGGNAIDAAAAAAFALMVTDPPMTSLAGRSEILIRLANGEAVAIDGETQGPAAVGRRNRRGPRSRYRVIPVPGNLSALAHVVEKYGRLSLAQVMTPAIRLAEEGFAVTPTVGALWKQNARLLAKNTGAAENFLRPDGSPYAAGDHFRQPRLAESLRRIASEGVDVFYCGSMAEEMASDITERGGYVRRSDLCEYGWRSRKILRTNYRGTEVLALGHKTGGYTLLEMLNILAEFRITGEDPAEESEILVRTMMQAMKDRSRHYLTVEPEKGGVLFTDLRKRSFARERAREIRAEIGKEAPPSEDTKESDGHTTHLSVMDIEGNAVALTTSIGRHFGSGLATPKLGFLYAYSYNLGRRARAGRRSGTAMTPAILVREGKPVLAIGGAGNYFIPAAVFQVISNLIDRGLPLEDAVAAPRIFAAGGEVEMHEGFSEAAAQRLLGLGFEVEQYKRSIQRHLGIVQAVQFDPERGEFIGSADPIYDGAAASPQQLP